MRRGGPSKKLIALGAAIGNHPDELRADLQRFFTLNLDGMGREYRCYHAAACIAHMPQDSALYAAVSAEEQERKKDPFRGITPESMQNIASSLGIRR